MSGEAERWIADVTRVREREAEVITETSEKGTESSDDARIEQSERVTVDNTVMRVVLPAGRDAGTRICDWVKDVVATVPSSVSRTDADDAAICFVSQASATVIAVVVKDVICRVPPINETSGKEDPEEDGVRNEQPERVDVRSTMARNDVRLAVKACAKEKTRFISEKFTLLVKNPPPPEDVPLSATTAAVPDSELPIETASPVKTRGVVKLTAEATEYERTIG
jgi:hypothetical protein